MLTMFRQITLSLYVYDFFTSQIDLLSVGMLVVCAQGTNKDFPVSGPA